MTKEKVISIVVLVLIVGAVVAFAMWGKKDTQGVAANTEPVATVNGVALTQADFDAQYAAAIASLNAQGTDTTSTTSVAAIRTQVLDNMIANALVVEGVTKANIKTSDADVEAQYQALVTQAGGVEKLNEQLAAANLTEAQLRTNIANQLAIQAYLLQNINTASTTVTAAEIKQFYDDNTKGQTDVPALKDVSAQIEQQLVLNKQQVLVNEFIAKLRANANIQTNLK